MASAKTKKKVRARPQRYTSNVFSMFSQAQIQEFKEAFNLIDQNHDGFIERDDLFDTLMSLGKNPSEREIEEMLSQAPGQLNFTMFLTMFGERMTGTDPEDVIKNAFALFDPDQTGNIPEDKFRELLTTMGDRWSEDQVDELFNGAPIKDGLFNYTEFTKTLKHGQQDEDAAPPQTVIMHQ